MCIGPTDRTGALSIALDARIILNAMGGRLPSTACGRLSVAVIPFRNDYAAMMDGLNHLEQVYQRERNTQQRLIQESERLE